MHITGKNLDVIKLFIVDIIFPNCVCLASIISSTICSGACRDSMAAEFGPLRNFKKTKHCQNIGAEASF